MCSRARTDRPCSGTERLHFVLVLILSFALMLVRCARLGLQGETLRKAPSRCSVMPTSASSVRVCAHLSVWVRAHLAPFRARVCECVRVCARACRLTLVSVCDVVELGTYGKLKYYHSMTEEGKILSLWILHSWSSSPLLPTLCCIFVRVRACVCMCTCVSENASFFLLWRPLLVRFH